VVAYRIFFTYILDAKSLYPQKYKFDSWAGWYRSVIPTTKEAEVGRS
jgi:hypothetical protein